MTTLFSHEAFHEDVRYAFDELLLMDELSRLPEASQLRLLQSFPSHLLRRAIASGRDAAEASSANPVI